MTYKVGNGFRQHFHMEVYWEQANGKRGHVIARTNSQWWAENIARLLNLHHHEWADNSNAPEVTP